MTPKRLLIRSFLLCIVLFFLYRKVSPGINEPLSTSTPRALPPPNHMADGVTDWPLESPLEAALQKALHKKKDSNGDPSKAVYVLPNVLHLGAQKTGSSSLAAWLFQNGVCAASVEEGEPAYYSKEPHFFNHPDRLEQGIDFYAKRYAHCDQAEFRMDATPNNFLVPEVVHAVYEAAGGNQTDRLRMLLMLREPISRELSWYNHKVRMYEDSNGGISWVRDVADENGAILSFEDYATQVLQPRLLQQQERNTGMYVDVIRAWLKHFSRDQILIMSYAELKQNASQTQDRIRAFLGTSALFEGPLPWENPQDSPHKVRRIDPQTRDELASIFGPKNEELYQFLAENPGPPMEERPFPRFVVDV